MSEPRSLSLQQLESRQMMAGDVTFVDHVLTVDMDTSEPRNLEIHSNSSGYVVISGNAELSWRLPDRIRAADVEKIVVHGTNEDDIIFLASVHKSAFSSLEKTEIYGRGGDDTIHGSRVHDVIFGGKGHDTIHGMDGKDIIRGGRGKDKIYGGKGADRLYGGRNDDLLVGGPSHADDRAVDRIFGGKGFDKYGFGNATIGKNDKLWGIESDLRETV